MIINIFIFIKYKKMYQALTQIWNVGIAIGPVLGYVYQYKLIRQKKSVGTFSINLCGVLLFCNILRVGFFISNRYSLALLFQSLFMIIVQILLLKLCVETMQLQGKFQNSQEDSNNQQQKGLFTNFWKWNTIIRYYYVVGVFFIAVMIIAQFFHSLEVKFIGQSIGFLSLISESLLMVPQIIENVKQGRIKGLSHLLVGLNFSGDLMKLGFFFVYNQPIQFILCGILQCIFDFVIIIQIIYYKKKNVTEGVVVQIESNVPKNNINEQLNYKQLVDKAKSETDQKSNDYKQFEDEAK